ncbi:hypothetical protein [Caenispirillum bisanense]|uniref:hypothetical protein n=1 Tax=Caenispirillum bisanense TaxID=414052 RepID=UPI0031DA1AAE
MTSRSAYAPRSPSPERRRPRPLSRRILIWWRRTLRSPRRLLTILAVVAGGAAAGIGVVVLLLLLLPGTPDGRAIPGAGAGGDTAGAADAPAAPEAGDQGPDRVALCQASVPHVNCRCFWQRLDPVLTEAELAAVAAALEVRASLGAFAARARLASDIGADQTRMVNRVLFECTGPS